MTELRQFLTPSDAARASHVLQKLNGHGVSTWALTGGLAIEIQRLSHGGPARVRSLNDVDFVAASFDCIPEGLAADFLFRHVHPVESPGRVMVQMIDPNTAVRIDVFRANGATMSRNSAGPFQLISLEDLLARTARTVLDIADGVPVAAKHASDFVELSRFIDPEAVGPAWQDHRKSIQPATFREAADLLADLIPASEHLLISPSYSTEVDSLCPRCVASDAFPLADQKLILAILGYC